MLDCYGEKEGKKPGTDNQENRRIYLIAMALNKASPPQRKILEESYGRRDEEMIQKVKDIYNELDIIGEFYKMEDIIHDQILNEIKKIPEEFARLLMGKWAYVFTYGKIGTPSYVDS
ncbi:hypothetical protein HHI36_001731 [Cryptolaemus montrouzieri]|uniref:Uncharacterized protein n=1 Tax=Cryptolaemus montrouzieri TaxID=559131 RepID=A0ABD2P8B3_9CUCU